MYSFGDSWAYGSELDFETEFPFVKHFSDLVGANYVNHGKPGSSLGLILKTVVDKLDKLTPQDIVLVIVPPDVRWYSENKQGYYSIGLDHNEYKSFLQDKTDDWFKYHHALYILAMQHLLETKKVKYVMAFNYGSDDALKYPNIPVNKDVFVSTQDLLSLLEDKPIDHGTVWIGYTFHEDGPSAVNFKGKYFEGKMHHPNNLGHQKIAKIFLDSYNKLYNQ